MRPPTDDKTATMADSSEPVQRPRLNLKPRDPEAAKRLELERANSAKAVSTARQRGAARERLLLLLCVRCWCWCRDTRSLSAFVAARVGHPPLRQPPKLPNGDLDVDLQLAAVTGADGLSRAAACTREYGGARGGRSGDARTLGQCAPRRHTHRAAACAVCIAGRSRTDQLHLRRLAASLH